MEWKLKSLYQIFRFHSDMVIQQLLSDSKISILVFVRQCVFPLLVICFSLNTRAQSLPVGMPGLDDYYRRLQLAGRLDSTTSFTIRPLFPGLISTTDSTRTDPALHGNFTEDFYNTSDHIKILPFIWQQQYHSNPFYNRNNGALVPAKGYQTLLSPGVFAKYKFLSIQLRPEFVFAENKTFTEVPAFYGGADLPSRLGTKGYSKLLWGQSSIRLSFGPVSFGLSNENLWWGPGIQNALLMSNSSRGFKHLTLNTNRPIMTPAGSIEGQIVAGRLEGSGENGSAVDDWRYLSGMAFTYQPRWLPGVFLGITRSFQTYHSDLNKFKDYFPLIRPFQKANDKEQDTLGTDKQDQLTSVFGRLMIPKAKAEVYLEYGFNDHAYNVRDFITAPEHSRAYTLGFKKLIPFKEAQEEYIQVGAELTHLEQSLDRLVRAAGEWYTHAAIVQGYTHRGEVLGAGIGPGGNFQSLHVAWVQGLKQIGLQLERYEHNGDLANFRSYSPWIDFNLGAYSDWTFGRMLVNAKLQGIKSINYQWLDGFNGRSKRNVFNINAQVGIMYSF